MRFLIPLCVPLLLLVNDAIINGQTTAIRPYDPSDPCNTYTVLDEPWRATSNKFSIKLMCDTSVSWSGWYRLFLRGHSVQMPDTCVDDLSCGTHVPLWLNGAHPRIEDGVVTRGVCGNWFNNCCYFQSNPIQVKACRGNYYVYEFKMPTVCYGAYCSDDRNMVIPTVSPGTTLSGALLADPCYSYTVLDEPWRAIDQYQYNNLKCDSDVNWSGWYRLSLHGQRAQMPESCVKIYSCSTVSPLWLNGQHPRVEDGVVTRHVCGHWSDDCCHFQFYPIKVKACPGNYYVYELVSPTFCFVGYCAVLDPRSNKMSFTSATPTTPITVVRDPCSDLNCTENEWCGKHNGVYGCFCNQTQPTSNPDTFDAYETCESSSGLMSLSRCQLFEAGFLADLLHLNDPSCRGTVQNGRVEFRFDNNDHICGTSLMANGTHIIYENFIFGQQGSAGGVISRKTFLRLHFNCVYHQTQSVSMDINPLESIVHRNIEGLGTYQVRMLSYQDAQFSKPFTGRADVEVDRKIFVEVRVDGVDGHQFASVIDSCWATPVNDPQSSLRWDLIVEECPNPSDDTVELLQNGVATSSRFSFRMFTFTANSTTVYLHCKIHLCLLTNNTCTSQCQPGQLLRMGRSLDFHDTASISMGPLVWSNGNSDILVQEQVKASMAPARSVSLMVLFVLVFSAYIIF